MDLFTVGQKASQPVLQKNDHIIFLDATRKGFLKKTFPYFHYLVITLFLRNIEKRMRTLWFLDNRTNNLPSWSQQTNLELILLYISFFSSM